MPSRRATLPREVLLLALPWLAFRELTLAAGICAKWRALVLDSRAFCGNVRIDVMTHWRLWWAAQQLMAGQRDGRPLRLEIVSSAYEPHLESHVFGWMEECLHRIEHLVVSVNSRHLPSLWKSLSSPAPMLKSLHVTLHLDEREGALHRFPVPRELFGFAAGNLQTVHLTNVFLPHCPPASHCECTGEHHHRCLERRGPTAIVPALHNVSALSLTYSPGQWSHLPRNVDLLFPNLVQIELGSNTSVFGRSVLTTRVELKPERRRREPSFLDREDLRVLSRITQLPLDISVISPSEDAVRVLLHGVPGPLHMRLTRNDSDSFRITVVSGSTRARCHFVERVEYYDKCIRGLTQEWRSQVNLLFHDLEFSTSVNSLTIDVSLWSLLAPLLRDSFHDLPVLVVRIDSGRRFGVSWLPEEPLAIPGLQCLIFQAARATATLDISDILFLADRITPKAVALTLDRIALHGFRRKRLRRRFSSVSCSD
ncbi:hypothetical protein EXIGLDRAFT_763644 [Exidia glandulosa HHB12029]|uniref:F-box domain-containing protein n=1 Tax=Exidia glandulosa HHB12029 TaxID=1314781 RepID=A0A165LUH5_EXIGL|nr:hypothetical protein EXIGLDRAFT_763644 [Exidia glandulosa HHB12029]